MTVHVPILLDQITRALIEPLSALAPDAPPHWLVDCTLGGGGHSAALLDALAREPSLTRHKLLAIDQDERAVEQGRARFAEPIARGRMEIHHSRISQIAPLLLGKPVLGILADLGFSSDQMDDPARGLSFRSEGPLDMRLDPSTGQSAREYISQIPESELARVLREYGEERFAGRIAAAIVRARRESGAPRTAKELSDLIVRAIPAKARHGKIHAATRSFQALRIAVNQELEELDYLLDHVILSLQPGGRIAILSFHSLEDRRVKIAFKSRGERDGGADSPVLKALTKKPVEADREEVRSNPRSRSAKLRIAERIG